MSQEQKLKTAAGIAAAGVGGMLLWHYLAAQESGGAQSRTVTLAVEGMMCNKSCTPKVGMQEETTPMCMPCVSRDEAAKSASWDLGIDHKEGELRLLMEGKTDLRSYKSGYLTPTAALAANRDLPAFIAGLPKAELHLHIEGTLTPSLAYSIAQRNGYSETMLEELNPAGAAKRREEFTSLFPFLVEYSNSSQVLQKEQDFYELCYAYLLRASENRVSHVEMFFDPQSHCFHDVSGDIANPHMNPDSATHLAVNCGGASYDPNGVGPRKLDFDVVYRGLTRAIKDGAKLKPPVDATLILCFLRDRSPEEAAAVLELAVPVLSEGLVVAVGIDNREGAAVGHDGTHVAPNPPTKFTTVYKRAAELGLQRVAHAGEEGPSEYVQQAREVLGCARIDHGVRILEDPSLAAQKDPDDPVYDGFISSNYMRTARDCGLSPDELVRLAVNSFEASFITPEQTEGFLAQVKDYCATWDDKGTPLPSL